jgi:hypothetical protein
MPKNNKAPKLSKVQQNMLSQAQGMVKSSGQNPAEMQRLTGLYGDMNAPKETPKIKAKSNRICCVKLKAWSNHQAKTLQKCNG